MKKMFVLLSLIPALTLVGCIVEESTVTPEDQQQATNSSSGDQPGTSSQGGPGGLSSSSIFVDTTVQLQGVQGVVADENGLPLVGAIVSLYFDNDYFDARNTAGTVACGAVPMARTAALSSGLQVACISAPLAYDTTDANGVFQFTSGVSDGDYTLSAEYSVDSSTSISYGAADGITVINGKSFSKMIIINLHPVYCTEEYAPVCANGETFGNACYAKAAGQTEWSIGVCEVVQPISCAVMDCAPGFTCVETYQKCLLPSCDIPVPTCVPVEPETLAVCPEIYAPVCANGTTYGNSCEARADGITEFTEGECNIPNSCINQEDCKEGETCVIPDVAICDTTPMVNGELACTMPMPAGNCIALPQPLK